MSLRCISSVRLCACACGSATACVRVLVGACEFAHTCVCAHSQSSHSEEGGAENPGLIIWNYFCWVIAWRVSSLCAPPQCLRVFPRLSPASLLLLGWMMGYDCPDGCWSSTLALTRLGIASSTYLGSRKWYRCKVREMLTLKIMRYRRHCSLECVISPSYKAKAQR